MTLNMAELMNDQFVKRPIMEINPEALAPEELRLIDRLARTLDLVSDEISGIPLTAEKNKEGRLSVSLQGRGIHISYPTPAGFARGLSHLRNVWQTGQSVEEKRQLDDCALLLDVSRNAVLSVSSVKLMLNYMAVMGYNCLMLYTEDTYQLPGYPYFGYQRGAYSAGELREIDAYAASLGIEVIPCMQTLAHLATTLRWPYADQWRDNDDILLAGDEETYKFIEEMFRVLRSCLRSKRIHVGMDEAHGIGRGRYMDLHGYRPPYEIMREHLDRVIKLAEEAGFKPMIWSDMFFRFASPERKYVDPEAPLTEAVKASVPQDIGLVYWDYYHQDEETYDMMLGRHQELSGRDIWFAGGLWTWNGIKVNHGRTFLTSKPALEACRRHRIRHVIATIWGDNGAETNVFEALPGMQYFAEFAWREEIPERAEVLRRLAQTSGINSMAFYAMRYFDEVPGVPEDNPDSFNPGKYILWSDPLTGLFDAHILPVADELIRHYGDLAEYFDYCAEDSGDHHRLFYLQSAQLADVLQRKVRLIAYLRQAYLDEDAETLQQLAIGDIPDLIAAVTDLQAFTLSIWYLYNKPEGSEVIDMRFGAQLARLKTCQDRVDGYLSGVYEQLLELENERLPFDGRSEQEVARQPHTQINVWQLIASANPL